MLEYSQKMIFAFLPLAAALHGRIHGYLGQLTLNGLSSLSCDDLYWMQYGDVDHSRVIVRAVKSAREVSLVKAARFSKRCYPTELTYPAGLGVALLLAGCVMGSLFRARFIGGLLSFLGALVTLIPLAWYFGSGYYSYIHAHGELE